MIFLLVIRWRINKNHTHGSDCVFRVQLLLRSSSLFKYRGKRNILAPLLFLSLRHQLSYSNIYINTKQKICKLFLENQFLPKYQKNDLKTMIFFLHNYDEVKYEWGRTRYFRWYKSKLYFGLYQWIHLVHVACDPHHPHLNCHKCDRQLCNAISSHFYLKLASLLASEEFFDTVLSTQRPATIAITSHMAVPMINGPILQWFV